MATPEPGLILQRAMRIRSSPTRVLNAFFDPNDLSVWWEVSRSVTLPRPLGPYAVQWPPTDFEDEILGRLGGTLHGTVMDYRAGVSCFVADVYYQPPAGDPIGPMALDIQTRPIGDGRSTEVAIKQSAEDDGPRWRRYFEVMGAGWDQALDALREHLEWSGVRPVRSTQAR